MEKVYIVFYNEMYGDEEFFVYKNFKNARKHFLKIAKQIYKDAIRMDKRRHVSNKKLIDFYYVRKTKENENDYDAEMQTVQILEREIL